MSWKESKVLSISPPIMAPNPEILEGKVLLNSTPKATKSQGRFKVEPVELKELPKRSLNRTMPKTSTPKKFIRQSGASRLRSFLIHRHIPKSGPRMIVVTMTVQCCGDWVNNF